MMNIDVENWEDSTPNQQQRYLTHGVFRYFGKLPPTITGRILDDVGIGSTSNIVDVMCGSGTTLLEAGLRGATATGIDCNEISVLISRVKTTPVGPGALKTILASFDDTFAPLLDIPFLDEAIAKAPGEEYLPPARSDPPKIRNINHWFVPQSVRLLCRVRDWVDGHANGRKRDIARLAFVSAIRNCSRASIRTGRLFRDVDKRIPNPVADVRKRLLRIGDSLNELWADLRWGRGSVRVAVGDARKTDLRRGVYDLIFCHPPYFALYKYSSDVLRFEMEWAGIDRKVVVRREIEDGFKTTDATLVEGYVRDLVDVAREAGRLAKSGAHLVFVTANSTLRKQPLAVLEPLIQGTSSVGWELTRRIQRRVRFAQASYHRSADSEIKRPDDEILVFHRTA